MKPKLDKESLPMELHVIRFREFVKLDGHGHLDMEASHAALSQLAQLCRKRCIECSLLDGRDMQTGLTPGEIAALVRDLAEMGFTRNQRIALLHRGDQSQRAGLFALIGNLRGWKIRTFVSFEEAIDWLSTGPPARKANSTAEEIPLRQKTIPVLEPQTDRKQIHS
jgi:hypothetical protein